jgi:cyclophilin family peptidyl-prolyl cis-trans isomerase
MWPLLLLQLQATTPPGSPSPALSRYDVLAAEHLREAGLPVLRAALTGSDTSAQRLAVRAVGRLEQPALRTLIDPLASSPAVSVRIAVAQAYGQMRAPVPSSILTSERDAAVRGAWFAAAGRSTGSVAEWEPQLTQALSEPGAATQRGAARGLEALLRLNARTLRPSTATLNELRRLAQTSPDGETRLIAMLALSAARDRDSITVAAALRDRNAEVRRAAVAMGRVWVEDTSAMVRWQSLQGSPSCEHATARLADASEHVRLLAIDQLGTQRCDAALLRPLLAPSAAWRARAHATVSLARIDTTGARALARTAVRALAASPVWQARAWAAQAARLAQDSTTLRRLARDVEPNVALAALTAPTEALALLSRDHAGAVLAGAELLAKAPSHIDAWNAPLTSAFARITRAHGVTWRDPKVAIVKAMRGRDASTLQWLGERLYDADPGVARAAADQLKAITGVAAEPITRSYAPPPFPTAQTLAAIDTMAAVITIRGKGSMMLALAVEDAPMAVYTFLEAARAKRFDGKTIHRIVPNFVVQGGSPGADEYDPVTTTFMRDEVGGANLRGTLGISTRGRDTGDGQLYMNLIYNLRLDGDYTVFGAIVLGLEVMDRIQEGDVIESVRIGSALVRAVK